MVAVESSSCQADLTLGRGLVTPVAGAESGRHGRMPAGDGHAWSRLLFELRPHDGR